MITDDELKVYLNYVLIASGSNLKHYSMAKSIDDMIAAMRVFERFVRADVRADESTERIKKLETIAK